MKQLNFKVVILLFLALTVGGLNAEDSKPIDTKQAPSEIAQQGLVKQEQIRANSKKVEGELSAMIDEYERNGLNDNKIQSLKSLKGIIGKLSGEDMEKVLALLKSAAKPADAKASLTAIAGAYSQQKSMVVQFKQILSMYQSDQVSIELAESVRLLADREAANLQAGIETAQWTLGGAKPAEGAVEASLQAQAAEQNAIIEESKILIKKIDAFAKETKDQEVAARFIKGSEDFKKITPNLDAAADSLSKKKLFEAVGTEKTARDQMRQLARAIALPKENSKQLKEAGETLDKLISQQKVMLTLSHDTQAKTIDQWLADEFKKPRHGSLASLAWNKALTKDDIEKLLSLPQDKMVQEVLIKNIYGSYQNGLLQQLTGLEDQQGDLANQADLLSQDLDKTAKPAADLLRSAIPPMQDARTAINEKDSAVAEKAQKSAVDILEKVKASLEQQLAAAQKMEALSGDKVAQMQDIKKQIQDLQVAQTELAKTTATPKPPEQATAASQQEVALQAKASQLQQQASDTPAAAESLGAAAANMKQAADAMPIPAQVQQALNQQQQALQNLAKASQQLDQQIKDLSKLQQDLAAEEKALKDVKAIIEAEQKLQLDTAKAAPKQDEHAAAIKAMAPRQLGIKNDTDALQKSITTPDAQQPLVSAARNMQEAQVSLGNANAKRAESDEQKALTDLLSIKQSLEAAIQDAEKQLGQTKPEDTQPAAQAQAEANLDQAMQEMDKNADTPADKAADDAAAAAQLAQAAQKTGEAAAEAKGLTPEAEKALQAATEELAQAAGDAAAGQKEEAQAHGKKAKDALKQASAAISKAEAGIADEPPSNDPPDPHSKGNDKGSQQEGGTVVAGGEKKNDVKSQFLGLPARERATIQQAQSEKYPQQYATKVEQYYQNLSDESSQH